MDVIVNVVLFLIVAIPIWYILDQVTGVGKKRKDPDEQDHLHDAKIWEERRNPPRE